MASQADTDPGRWSEVSREAHVKVVCKVCGKRSRSPVGWAAAVKPCATHPDGCPDTPAQISTGGDGPMLLEPDGCRADPDAPWIMSAGTGDRWVLLRRTDTPPTIPMACPTHGDLSVPVPELTMMLTEQAAQLPARSKRAETFRASPGK